MTDDSDHEMHDVMARSIVESVKPLKICPVCEEGVPELYSVSFFCEDVHKYCATCVKSVIQVSGFAVARCPGCQALAITGPQEPMIVDGCCRGIMDPHFLSQIPGVAELLVNGNQLQPFLRVTQDTTSLIAHCPKCKSFTVGSPSSVFQNVARCCRNECGHLFCRCCSKTYHSGHCDSQDTLVGDQKLLSTMSRHCPSCAARITHNHDHGCHRVTCLHCRKTFCYMCGATVVRDPSGDEMLDTGTCRCPIFCEKDCGCPPCPDCKPGKMCVNCTGCDVCIVQTE